MDGARGALVPLAAAFRLRGAKASDGCIVMSGEMGEGSSKRSRMEPRSRKRRPVWTASSPKTGPKWAWKGPVELSTISNGSTPYFSFVANGAVYVGFYDNNLYAFHLSGAPA
jgi:hypothetical protein